VDADADVELLETAKWHLRNSNCKQVILGISHDAGYAPFLNGLFQDPSLRIRVTVLEGIPIVREVAATGVNILNLNGRLFRSEKLVPSAALPHCDPTSPTGTKTTTASNTSAGIPTPSTSTTSTPGQVTASTYALAVKNPSPPPEIPSPTQPKPAVMSPTRTQPAKSTTWYFPRSWSQTNTN
jgi:hypothetical protein